MPANGCHWGGLWWGFLHLIDGQLKFIENKLMRQLTLLLSLVLITGCTSFAPSQSMLGQSREAVIAEMGVPHSEVPEAQGKRLVYPRGPWGKSTFFVHLNAEGRVTRWEDVLTVNNFYRITPGMRAEQVEDLIGPSLDHSRVSKGNETIWNYPFHNSICQIFQVALTPAGLVDSIGFGYASECGNSA